MHQNRFQERAPLPVGLLDPNPNPGQPMRTSYSKSSTSLDNNTTSPLSDDVPDGYSPEELMVRQFSIMCQPLHLRADLKESSASFFKQIIENKDIRAKMAAGTFTPPDRELETIPVMFQHGCRELQQINLPTPAYSTRIWTVCSVFVACLINEETCLLEETGANSKANTNTIPDTIPNTMPNTNTPNSNTLSSSATPIRILHNVKLNQVVRCVGIQFQSLFHHLSLLQEYYPISFTSHLTQVKNFKLTFLYGQFLNEKWRNMLSVRDTMAKEGIVARRGKSESETKLQQFSWILFMLCKEKLFEEYTLPPAYDLLVCVMGLVIEAHSATTQEIRIPGISAGSKKKAFSIAELSSSSSSSFSSSSAATSEKQLQVTKAITSSTNPLDFLSALASVAATGSKDSEHGGGTDLTDLSEEEVNAAQQQAKTDADIKAFKSAKEQANIAVIESLVARLGNVQLANVLQYCTPVHAYVDELVSNTILRIESVAPPLRTHGCSSNTLRAALSPKMLSFNAYSVSKIYGETIHTGGICDLDETIYLEQYGGAPTPEEEQNKSPIYEKNSSSSSSSSSSNSSSSNSSSSSGDGSKKRDRTVSGTLLWTGGEDSTNMNSKKKRKLDIKKANKYMENHSSDDEASDDNEEDEDYEEDESTGMSRWLSALVPSSATETAPSMTRTGAANSAVNSAVNSAANTSANTANTANTGNNSVPITTTTSHRPTAQVQFFYTQCAQFGGKYNCVLGNTSKSFLHVKTLLFLSSTFFISFFCLV